MLNLATDEPAINGNDLLMAKHMADLLYRVYPGHLWAVTCDGDKGTATVRNLGLSGNHGFILKLPAIYSASDWDKQVMRAGGEVLERYRVARGRANEDHLAALPTDFAGRHRFDA